MKQEEIKVDGYEQVVKCVDGKSGLRAIIAIHDTTLGPALGGMRMWPYTKEEDALTDVLRLSRGMTYKSAVADCGLGGGKSVIIGDSRKDKTPELFMAMGEFVESLDGRYITAEDVGTSVEDMTHVYKKTKHVTGLSREVGSSGDPSPFTAHGIFLGIKVSCKEKYGSDDVEGKVIAVQGLGHVGWYICQFLAEAGAGLVVTDISAGLVGKSVKEFKADAVDADVIYDVECDVFCPCALGAIINDDTINRFKCGIIAGAANNQLHDIDMHGKMLRDRDILYAPDYVINSGGLINVSMELEPSGYNEEKSRAKISNIPKALEECYRIAKEEGISTAAAADHLAEARIAAGKKS
ncbi:MAG: Glu/Leu/Phe/Val dehydrogenase [Planctomycetota bacterium]|nr:MAG: Glu/Leu/Phe/Val dehydrogenase [Planctomycetota bacterium]